ncbi:hypothetical protein ACFWNK_09445 [Streptomyces sp. NPDC058417]|uniref:hypothetical protein n=1 Tax=unclassified Streptomyces TaxID=2593676 RepID=UPI00364B6BDC
MYEMKVGLASGGGEQQVWHVVIPHHGTSLCGTVVSATGVTAANETDRHCTPCMAHLQTLLDPERA